MDEFRSHLQDNRALWDEWTRVHEASAFYDLEGFKRGGVRLRPFEIEDVGDVAGKTLLHLQCHFGIDTLSWARLGAKVTGVDFSERGIELARRVAEELGIEATFVQADIYDLPKVLEGEFDVVYTSRGALGWLPDIDRWGEIAAGYVKPGGVLYVHEGHPFIWIFEEEPSGLPALDLRYPYWTGDPMSFPVEGSYADPTAEVDAEVEHGWNHSLGEIVTALARNGLRIEFLREEDFLDWEIKGLVRGEDGYWRLPPDLPGSFPLSFTLKARRS